jgi:signal transduction histidine kinase
MRFHLQMSDPQKFAAVSLLIIAAVVVATSVAESSFYRRAIVIHESMIFSDMVRAIASRDEVDQVLSSWDLKNYTESVAQAHLAHTFSVLERLPGFARIKVIRSDQMIAWSDAPRLIGTPLRHHKGELARAFAGEVGVVFDAEQNAKVAEDLPQVPLLELYVPFTLPDAGSAGNKVIGVLSIYRSPTEINNTIQRGLYLLWFVTGLGGLILYAALYRLFYAVYYSRKKFELQFNLLSREQGRLMQIEKLSALGQMVSEIAHQLNNPLVGVINLAQLAEREVANPQRVKELLGEIRKAGDHCRDFVQRMLRINKIARPEWQPTDMNELASSTIDYFRRSLDENLSVKLEASAETIILQVDPILVRNALFNLIHNAVQAAPTGTVTVSLALDEQDGVAGCRIAVSDSGPGIAPEVADKLFNPLFTTRPDGTGLGLAIAQHVAALHHGYIRAENNPGGGAIFTMWLPTQGHTA